MTNDSGVSPKDIVWPIVTLVVALIAGVVALAVLLPESRSVTEIVTPLIALVSTIALMIGGWVTLRRVDAKVDRVAEVVENTAADTAEIKQQTNGKLQAEVERIAIASAARALEKHAEREGDL